MIRTVEAFTHFVPSADDDRTTEYTCVTRGPGRLALFSHF